MEAAGAIACPFFSVSREEGNKSSEVESANVYLLPGTKRVKESRHVGSPFTKALLTRETFMSNYVWD